MEHLICPLCKRELSAGTLDTRLCEQCQALVQTASRPGALNIARTSGDADRQRVVTHAGHDAPQDNLSFEVIEEFEQGSVADYGCEPDPLFSQLFDSQDGFVTTPQKDDHSDHDVHTPEANLLDQAASGSISGSDERSPLAAQLDHVEAEATSTNVSEEEFPNERAVTSSEASTEPTPRADEKHFDDLQSISEVVSADPWENALPAAEYSRNEWPVLVSPPRAGLFTRSKTPIVVLVILVLVVGVYYLIHRQTSSQLVSDAPAPELPSKVAEPRASAKPPSQDKALSSSPEATAASEPKATQPGAHDAVMATKENSQGQIALQAAAFPNRAAADEFVGRLQAAGVQSYIVSVELPHRGTWFRVRVGRFNTAAEAQRFAADAQFRARGRGMSLELIVSPYEQP